MASLGTLNRRISVLEQRRLKSAPSRRVVVVPDPWDERSCGLDPDAVQMALAAHPDCVLVVPAPVLAEEWNLASARHHSEMLNRCPLR
jgi:hypothetical protein